jgi:hypothetical protein
MKRLGHIYFTAATVDTDARQVDALAWEAMTKADSVADAAHKFAQKSDEIARRTAAHAPKQLVDMCWGKSCTEAVFFGIEHGTPTLVLVKLEQAGSSRESLKFVPHEFVCPGTCPNQPRVILSLGQHKDIDEFERGNRTFLKNHSDQDAARKLVEVEEKAVPEWVGGPIDVLTLDASGAHWRESGTCAAAANPDNDKPRRQK